MPHSVADPIAYIRKLMCSPGGRDYIEREILKPFGYVMADRETAERPVATDAQVTDSGAIPSEGRDRG